MDIEQVSYTKFRMHLAPLINHVTKSNLPLLITRRNHESAYLISKEMYEHLIRLSFKKLKTNKSATSAVQKIDLPSQKPVRVTTSVQQDLFNQA